MALGSPPDRRPEGDDLSEQFLGQLGGEEIFQEPLVAAGPDRSGRVARAERSQSDQLVGSRTDSTDLDAGRFSSRAKLFGSSL